MLSEKQMIEISERRTQTLELFLKNPTFSDNDLAFILIKAGVKTSSSTVGRDLVGDWIKEEYSPEIYEKVMIQRKNNLIMARRKGGLISQELYGYSQDDNGQFLGRNR